MSDRLKASAGLLIASAVLATGTTAYGSFQGRTAAASERAAASGVAPVIQFSSVGASTYTVSNGDSGSRRTTPPVVVTTPSGDGTYTAHVSISSRYHAVGSGKFYIKLVTATVDAAYSPPVTPTQRLVARGDTSVTTEFWVKNLRGGRSYKFIPEVSGPTSNKSYINLYDLLTRVDVLPAS